MHNHAIIRETYRLFIGLKVYKRIRKRYGKSTHIIIVRGATGDVYIQLLLLNEYIRQHMIDDYILVGDGAAMERIMDLFYCSDYIRLPWYESECLEKLYFCLGSEKINALLPFIWGITVFKYNDCRIRKKEVFNFMDTYIYCSFNLKKPIIYRFPNFKKVDDGVVFWWNKVGIVKDRTVIVSPEANSVTTVPPWFWNGITTKLQERGYIVFINCTHPNFYRACDFVMPYDCCVPLLEYAGYFLAVRSGLCDIVSTAKCNKIILYPEKRKKIDYSFHRSEKEFSSLEEMGLSDSEGLYEISTPLLSNITDRGTMLKGTKDYFRELKKLEDAILNIFEEKEQKRLC